MPILPLFLAATTADPELRMRLMGHAESVYAMAHALTLNASEAVELVEAVYRRAADESLPVGMDEKLWLLTLLKDERQRHEGSLDVMEERAGAGDFRHKLALRAVQRAMPAAFTSLPADARELLMLVHVERYSITDVARFATTEPDDAAERLRHAEAGLRAGLLRGLNPAEAGLLRLMPDNWLREAINDMVANDLPAMPPTVRTDVGGAPAPTTPPAGPAKPARRRRQTTAGERLRRTATALFIIFLAGLFAYGAARILDRPPETNALVLSVEAASDMNLDLASSDAAEVERYVRDAMDWRLTVPSIEGATLMGVQIRELAEGIRVPALYFDDSESSGPITLVVFTYALLDHVGERLQFDPATLSQIQDPAHYDLHDLGRQQLLIWRQRNNIFVAVTRGQAETLQDRVYPAS